MNRMLSDKFEKDLQDGLLKTLLECVKKDHTLMLAIRKDYVNVYYRGGNILKLKANGGKYEASFDEGYARGQSLNLPDSSMCVASETDIRRWVESFPVRKQIMDFWFIDNPQKEREFQQLVVRENNVNETDYFIADIELALPSARFDMLAFKWTSTERKVDKVGLALIEMKHGDGALTGPSGILAHLTQLDKFLSNSESRESLRDMATQQINQLNRLGLISHTKPHGRNFGVVNNRLEVVFLFANHNPRSSILLRELSSPDFSALVAKMKDYCDVRFFTPNSAGYGIYKECTVDYDSYVKFLGKFEESR